MNRSAPSAGRLVGCCAASTALAPLVGALRTGSAGPATAYSARTAAPRLATRLSMATILWALRQVGTQGRHFLACDPGGAGQREQARDASHRSGYRKRP